jgi:hypothetical protein
METTGVPVPDHRWNHQGQQHRTSRGEKRPCTGSIDPHDTNAQQAVSDGGAQRADQKQVHQDEHGQGLERAQSGFTETVVQKCHCDQVAQEPVHAEGSRAAPEPGERSRPAFRHTKSSSWIVFWLGALSTRALERECAVARTINHEPRLVLDRAARNTRET